MMTKRATAINPTKMSNKILIKLLQTQIFPFFCENLKEVETVNITIKMVKKIMEKKKINKKNERFLFLIMAELICQDALSYLDRPSF